jgi:D-beta-D-heptose 7-phosphate kinase/D-beta-D-heptose 1-phosphate adenosyltransferase
VLPGPAAKVASRAEIAERAERHRLAGERIVFTNGCFDLLHVGHVTYLAEARALGDRLIVGLNADASVRRLKGAARPIVGEQDRAAMLAALASVDYVVLFDEDTPLDLIRAVRPDVLVKGGGYEAANIVGRDVVESYGGRVCVAEMVPGVSTTGILARLAAGQSPPRPHFDRISASRPEAA